MSDPPSPCTFDGHASIVHLKGHGPAILTEGDAFSGSRAARVEIPDAELKRVDPPEVTPIKPRAVERPDSLEPLNTNPEDADYDVTYYAGPPVLVQVDTGGGAGLFHGRAPGVDCTGPRGCDVIWGAGPKLITLHRDAGPEPVALTGKFPLAERDAAAAERNAVKRIALTSVKGTLTCGGRAETLAGEDLLWREGAWSVSEIRIDREGLALIVDSAAQPERSRQSLVPIAATAFTGVLLLAGLVVFLRLRRRKPPNLPQGAKLTGADLKDLAEALLSAFPTRDVLAQMLRFGLDRKLDEIAAASNLRATVFELVKAAEAQGWIPQLVEAALAQVPGNAALRAIAEKHRA